MISHIQLGSREFFRAWTGAEADPPCEDLALKYGLLFYVLELPEILGCIVLTEEDLGGVDPSDAEADAMTLIAGAVFTRESGHQVSYQHSDLNVQDGEFKGWIHIGDKEDGEVWCFTIENDGEDWTVDFLREDTVSLIQEILAGATQERPAALDQFFETMATRMNDGEGFAWAWSAVACDEEGEYGPELGNAIADFRDGELTERLGYQPTSDAFDEALENWICDQYM